VHREHLGRARASDVVVVGQALERRQEAVERGSGAQRPDRQLQRPGRNADADRQADRVMSNNRITDPAIAPHRYRDCPAARPFDY